MKASAEDAPVVVDIAGWGRSGSTLLDSLIADRTGTFGAGELEELWDGGSPRGGAGGGLISFPLALRYGYLDRDVLSR